MFLFADAASLFFVTVSILLYYTSDLSRGNLSLIFWVCFCRHLTNIRCLAVPGRWSFVRNNRIFHFFRACLSIFKPSTKFDRSIARQIGTIQSKWCHSNRIQTRMHIQSKSVQRLPATSESKSKYLVSGFYKRFFRTPAILKLWHRLFQPECSLHLLCCV
jgi:hypothetical protein